MAVRQEVELAGKWKADSSGRKGEASKGLEQEGAAVGLSSTWVSLAPLGDSPLGGGTGSKGKCWLLHAVVLSRQEGTEVGAGSSSEQQQGICLIDGELHGEMNEGV